MSQDIFILERSSQRLVSATFHEDVTADQLAEAASQWKPVRDAAIARLLSGGSTTREVFGRFQHLHWDWLNKSQALREGALNIRCFGIEAGGEWQGLVMIELVAHSSELSPDQGKPLVYVEFLESAPWNLKGICDSPRYGLVGVRLMEAAVRLSIEEGFHGRVGLLALPQAEPFYEKRCLMTNVEGAVRFGMKLYEMTRNNAVKFLGG